MSKLVDRVLKEGQVDTHFPFDPYKLPLTKGYIEDLFREFEAPPGDDSEDESEDEEEEIGSERGLAIPMARSQSSQELAHSLDAMSITPSSEVSL